MTTLLSSVISLQLCTCPSASIGNLPIYPFRYHCYFGHRIAYERVQDALLPSFASHGSISSISLFHTIKEDLRAIRQISRSLSETGFSGFFNQTFPASFCEPLIVVVNTIIYRTTITLPVFLPFHRWLGFCLKKINIRNVSKHVITHI